MIKEENKMINENTKSQDIRDGVEIKQGEKPQEEIGHKSDEKNKSNIGVSIIIFVFMIVGIVGVSLFLTIVGEQKIEDEIIDQPKSTEEIEFEDTLAEIEYSLNELDINEDFNEFEDGELSVGDVEEEFDNSLEEIDQIMEEISALEEELLDIDESDL